MFRKSKLLILLGVAVSLPYLLSSSTGLRGLIAWPLTAFQGQQTTAAEEEQSAKPSSARPLPQQVAGQPLQEVFRFDVTTAWVLGRWPRVSTGLAKLDLQGYRVPLVTGAAESDLAGSLTYYFNPKQRVQQITFVGTTGDARRLVMLLATKHGFVREITGDPGLLLYQAEERGQVISRLRIKPRRVIRSDRPHTRFDVDLVMQRPRSLK
jgi:hypothetical protein